MRILIILVSVALFATACSPTRAPVTAPETAVNAAAVPAKKQLFLDVHHLGAGKVTEADVAAAHQKDLAVQGKHGVKYLSYWVDTTSGTVVCLSEAPNAEAAIAVHKEAHGLLPESIAPVTEGR
jgi:hypothetical protein